MSDYEEKLPLLTPETQTAPRARAGGTNALNDFSESAQRSKSRQDFKYKQPPFEDPSHAEAAPEQGKGRDRTDT